MPALMPRKSGSFVVQEFTGEKDVKAVPETD